MVYYYYAYAQLLAIGEIEEGETINATVPTGNFGNILAAYYAKEMGLPIGKLLCASNDNKVLYDFMKNGEYDRNRDFHLTISPSMDILISSNLERLIYQIAGKDTAQTKELMESLVHAGNYSITDVMKKGLSDFYGNYATEKETMDTIKTVYDETGYLIDPHTAVARCVYGKYLEESGDKAKTVIASTASPYKFTRSTMSAVDEKFEAMEDFALINEMHEMTGVAVPAAITEILDAPVRHSDICKKEEMERRHRGFP